MQKQTEEQTAQSAFDSQITGITEIYSGSQFDSGLMNLCQLYIVSV
jgi:hypothetical protein